MNRQEKADRVQKLTEKLATSKGVYLADFTGLTVEKVSLLRREMRKAGVHVSVMKNTLLHRAMADGNYDILLPHLKGPTASSCPRRRRSPRRRSSRPSSGSTSSRERSSRA